MDSLATKTKYETTLNFSNTDVTNAYFTIHSMPLVSVSNDGEDYCNTKKKKKVLKRSFKIR